LSRLLTYNKTDATVTPLGLMFEIYRQHYGTIPVAVSGSSPQHDSQGTVNVDKSKVPSGSDTYSLDVTAAFTTDRKALTVAIVNPTESVQQLGATFAGVALQGPGRLWRIAPANLATLNEPGKPMVVNISASTLTEAPGQLEVPPISTSIYEFPVSRLLPASRHWRR
jgi:alpha-L-arabinofuranosidase